MDPKAPFAHCDDCPLRHRPFVPGHGPSKTDRVRVIVGEAPGETEVVEGKPFVGRAGAILAQDLESIGIDQSSVTGVAPNGIELHPVLSFSSANCART